MIRDARKHLNPEIAGVTSGDVEALSTGEDGDHYILIKKKQSKDEDDSD
jgi:hypothetical protein